MTDYLALAPEDGPNFSAGTTGYRIDLEDRQLLVQKLKAATELWEYACRTGPSWDEPDEIDPRAWFDVHNQGRVGSCQGFSACDGAEYTLMIAQGVERQLSPGWTYLASQEDDGLLGRDSGSTLAGGSAALRRGIPEDSVFGYTDNYASLSKAYRAQKQAILNSGHLYQVSGAVRIVDSNACRAFLSGWTGCVQIGIVWSIKLTNQWEIASYSATGGGGHAVLLCGYLKHPTWPEGYGFLLKNSWSKDWGKGGWALVKPSAFDSMMRSRGAVGIGRSDMLAPSPRQERVDHYRAIALK